MTNNTNFVAILIALFLGITGFSTLNNLNSLNQLQQKLDVLSAPILTQPGTLPSIGAEAKTQSNVQLSAGSTITETAQKSVESLASNDVLRFDSAQPLLLTRDVTNVTVSLVYSMTQPITIALQMLVAQDFQGGALDVGYHSDAIPTSLSGAMSRTTVHLPFRSLPPTGRYLAQLVAHNETMLVTQPVTLVVANEPVTTLQYRLTGISDDKQIVIAGSRWCPLLLGWMGWFGSHCDKITWNTSELLLWEKYLRPNSYYIVASELADPVNGRFGHLGISVKKASDNNESGPLPVNLESGPLTVAEPVSVSLTPSEDIVSPGAYTGTLTIIDVNDHSTETISILVRARDQSALPFAVILAFYFGVALVLNPASTPPPADGKMSFLKKFLTRYNWNRVAISFLWALLVAVAGMVYIENRLSTFGSASDYFAALGWLLGVAVITATGAVVMNRIMDSWLAGKK